MDTNAQTPTALEQQALDVFERHVAAFTSGNLDAIVRDFAEDAVVITPDGVFEGPAQIRTLYGGLLEEFGSINRGDSPGLTVDALYVRNDMIFITWHAESRHHVFPFGTDTFICKDDTFERQSIAFSEPRPRRGAAGES